MKKLASGTIAFVFVLIALPLLVVAGTLLHPVLRLFGLRGCFRDRQFIFDETSFERA